MHQLSEIVQLLKNKQFEHAVRQCQLALSSSNHPQIHLFQAIALGELGKIKESANVFQNLLHHFPQNLEIHFNYAMVLEKNSQIDTAIVHLEACLKLDNKHFPAARKLAFLLFESRNFHKALSAVSLCLQLEPDNPVFYNLQGLIYLDLKQRNHSIISFEKALAIDAKSLEYLINHATACVLSGNQAGLDTSLSKISSFGTAEALAFVASIYEKSNQHQKSQQHVDQGLALDSKHPELLFIDAKLKKESKDFEGCLKQLNFISSFSSETFKQEVLYEKAKTLDKLKNYDQAWKTANEANILTENEWRKNNSENDNYNKAFYEISESLTSLSNIKFAPATKNLESELCFIFGFTRSGTTLLDSILSSHSKVSVLEEIPLIRDLTLQFPKISPAIQFANMMNISNQQKVELRERYFNLIPRYTTQEKTPVIIDKSPLNTSLVAFIKNVFPESKMLFSIRHPLDVCVSCFFQQFEFNSYMTNMVSPEKIAKTYDAVLTVWSKSVKTFDIDVHYQKYEELITDFDNQTKNLIGYLGLEWQDDISNFQSSLKDRAIIPNPSYNQVNQPIYQSAKNRYKNYLPHLKEAAEILKPWIEHFGYKV